MYACHLCIEVCSQDAIASKVPESKDASKCARHLKENADALNERVGYYKFGNGFKLTIKRMVGLGGQFPNYCLRRNN